MDIFKAFRKKELGMPKGLQWQFVNGLFIPYDANDSLYVNRVFKAISIAQSLITKIAERAADATPQVMRIKDKREAEKYLTMRKYLNSKDKAQELARIKLKAFEQVDNHPFLEVMENPNPLMTGRELRAEEYGYLLATGNSIEYAAVPGSGARATQPRQLWNIPSPCVKPVMSGDRLKPISGYAVTYNYQNEIPISQITHVKYFNLIGENENYENSFWGLSPFRSFTNQASQKRYADVAQGSLFANMGPSGIISGNRVGQGDRTPELTEVQAGDMLDKFVQNHTGVYNGGGIVVTPSDVKWQQIGLSPVDLQILEFNKDLERQIANILGYPSQLLNPDGTLANSDSGDVRVVTNCILPLLRKTDDIRTRKIREWYGDNSLVYLSDTDVYPELEADKKELVGWMRSAGVFTQEEIRTALGYESEYDPSKVLVPSNLVSLSDVMGGELLTDQTDM
jgi:HK97 family phage portal protein